MNKPARPILTLSCPPAVPAKPAAKPEPTRPVLTLAKSPAPTAAKPAKPGKPAAPLKSQLTPEQRAARELEEKRAAWVDRKKAVAALRKAIMAAYPATFPTVPVPLAVGIREPLIAAVRGQHSRGTVKAFLRLWTTRADYLDAVAAGVARRDLDGSDAGEPTEDQRRMAADRLEERRLRAEVGGADATAESPENAL